MASQGMVQIQVQDTGIGIKEQDQKKLFNLFGFLENTKELNTRGVGLGLHISRKIVQQLGGSIGCESKWGVGTTFSFVVALDKLLVQDNRIENQRCMNPVRKVYPRIHLY